MKELKMNKIII